MITQSVHLGAVGAPAVTAADIKQVIGTAPAVLSTVGSFATQAARIAPTAVPAINKVVPLLTYGPQLAPLVRHVNAEIAALLQAAPQYASVLRDASALLAKAPALAPQIASVTSAMSATVQQIGRDPAFPQFAERLATIIALAQAKVGSSGGTPSGSTPASGVGLKYAVPWMDRAAFVMRNPWLLAAVPAAVVLVVGGVGFALGRATS
jgi:hypothetical protein